MLAVNLAHFMILKILTDDALCEVLIVVFWMLLQCILSLLLTLQLVFKFIMNFVLCFATLVPLAYRFLHLFSFTSI